VYDEHARYEIGQPCLSHWWNSAFTIDGVTYRTAEHWMMAQKARLFGVDAAYAKIVASSGPKAAKDLAATSAAPDTAAAVSTAPRLVAQVSLLPSSTRPTTVLAGPAPGPSGGSGGSSPAPKPAAAKSSSSDSGSSGKSSAPAPAAKHDSPSSSPSGGSNSPAHAPAKPASANPSPSSSTQPASSPRPQAPGNTAQSATDSSKAPAPTPAQHRAPNATPASATTTGTPKEPGTPTQAALSTIPPPTGAPKQPNQLEPTADTAGLPRKPGQPDQSGPTLSPVLKRNAQPTLLSSTDPMAPLVAKYRSPGQPNQPGVESSEGPSGVRALGIDPPMAGLAANDVQSPLLRHRGLPETVHTVVGVGEETGGIAQHLRDHLYPDAALLHVVPKAPGEGGLNETQRGLINAADGVVTFDPRATDAVRAGLDRTVGEGGPRVFELDPNGRPISAVMDEMRNHLADRTRETKQVNADELDARSRLSRQHDAFDQPEADRLRMLLVNTEWDRTAGGVSTVNQEMARGLALDGNAVIARSGEPGVGSPAPHLRLAGLDPIVGMDRSTRRGSTMAIDRHLPHDVDVVITHSRFGGAAGIELAEHVYPGSVRVHLLHTEPELLDRLKGTPADGIAHANTERLLMRDAHLIVGVGPRLAAEARRLASSPERPSPAIHELIPGIDAGPLGPRRNPVRDGYNLYAIGRAGDRIKGIDDAARIVKALNERGFSTNLTVRGVPEHELSDQQKTLGVIAGGKDRVQVKPYTTDQAEKAADLHDSDLVLIPSHTEGFGLTATEAAGHGLPILVARNETGVGQFLTDPNRVPQELARGSTVLQPNRGSRVPVWTDQAADVLKNLDLHRDRAAALRSYLTERYTWQSSMTELRGAIQDVIRNR